MRTRQTIEAMPFPIIAGLVKRTSRYLDDEFQNATGLAMMYTQRPILKFAAFAVVLVMWVGALASLLSLFGADRGHPTPADLIAMTLGAVTAMCADVARVDALRRRNRMA